MIVFLGDNGPHEEGSPRLAPEFFAANGWGPVERDAGNGRNAGGDGPPIALGGRVYEKGLGVVFQVWGDGEKLYDSGLVTAAGGPRSVDVPVAGVERLRLVVTDGGNGTRTTTPRGRTP